LRLYSADLDTILFPHAAFRVQLTDEELALACSLDCPEKIQEFLANQVAYNFEPDGATAYGPVEVLRRRTAHCFEGAVFAAALLWFHDWEPLLVLLEAPGDFDHNLVVYRRDGRWGSVSQSRHAELRGKPPSFACLRDLVLSYHPDYFSDWTHDRNDLTLRGFSPPIDLRAFGPGWVTAGGWHLYFRLLDGVRLEKLFPTGAADRWYDYPLENLYE
jgi:hypothetical protein